jgi:hypothetical protein
MYYEQCLLQSPPSVVTDIVALGLQPRPAQIYVKKNPIFSKNRIFNVLFPLNRRRRFPRNVITHPRNARHFIDNPI